MSGPGPLRQGLLIIPRAITYNSAAKTLTRKTEIWLVDEGNGASGPPVLRNAGLLIAFGFDNKPKVDDIRLTVCIRDKWGTPCQEPWIDLDGSTQKAKNFKKLLEDLLDAGPWTWKAWELAPHAISIPETSPAQCEGILVEYTVKNFKPKKSRGFHVVPVAVSAIGVPESQQHYILGLGVYTQHVNDGGVEVNDFMTMAYAMKAGEPRPKLPSEPNCSAVPCPRPVVSKAGGRRASEQRMAPGSTRARPPARSRA